MNDSDFYTELIPDIWTKYYNYSDIAADFYCKYGT